MTAHIGIALALILALATPAAAAPTASTLLQVSGDVPVRCKMSPPSASGAANATFTSNGTGGDIAITALVGSDAMTLASQASLQIPIVCSGSHALTVTTRGGLANQNAATPSPDFAVRADYLLTARWGAVTQSVTTSGSAVTLDLSQGSAQAGDLSLDISLPAGKGPMTSGTYTDEITIQLNAQ